MFWWATSVKSAGHVPIRSESSHPSLKLPKILLLSLHRKHHERNSNDIKSRGRHALMIMASATPTGTLHVSCYHFEHAGLKSFEEFGFFSFSHLPQIHDSCLGYVAILHDTHTPCQYVVPCNLLYNTIGLTWTKSQYLWITLNSIHMYMYHTWMNIKSFVFGIIFYCVVTLVLLRGHPKAVCFLTFYHKPNGMLLIGRAFTKISGAETTISHHFPPTKGSYCLLLYKVELVTLLKLLVPEYIYVFIKVENQLQLISYQQCIGGNNWIPANLENVWLKILVQ